MAGKSHQPDGTKMALNRFRMGPGSKRRAARPNPQQKFRFLRQESLTGLRSFHTQSGCSGQRRPRRIQSVSSTHERETTLTGNADIS